MCDNICGIPGPYHSQGSSHLTCLFCELLSHPSTKTSIDTELAASKRRPQSQRSVPRVLQTFYVTLKGAAQTKIIYAQSLYQRSDVVIEHRNS